MLKRAGRYLIIYVAIIACGGRVMYVRLPTSFLPGEDQGTMLVNVQLPPGATLERTQNVMHRWSLHAQAARSAKHGGVLGFSFSGQGQNAALAFVTLKDWSERKGDEHSAQALAGRAFGG
jgi:multidrug efflux pump